VRLGLLAGELEDNGGLFFVPIPRRAGPTESFSRRLIWSTVFFWERAEDDIVADVVLGTEWRGVGK
jgi:hypothetical protein